jgi:myo-inositol-1(or 4)-monophosphatase
MHQIEPIPRHLRDRLEAAVDIARKTGSMLLGARLETRISREKGLNDIVTEFDGAAERMIVGHLGQCFPEDRFFGEEMGSSKDEGAGGRWIIDPIDGTVNFTRGMPNYTISIAYEETQGEPVVGVVYNPVQAELYTAVSEIDRPQESIAFTSLPHRTHTLAKPYLAILDSLFLQTREFRNLGSAALHMCYLASGRADAFFEYGLHYYDIAAGMIILTEAGGTYGAFLPEARIPDNGDCVATNGLLQSWYTGEIRKVLKRLHAFHP